MRDHVLLALNGTVERASGDAAFQPLAAWLREARRLTGTKVVCAEGDCGACTVLVGRPGADGTLAYLPVNSCIQFLFQLDGAHVVTVEGLRGAGEPLTEVQKRMVDLHGAQCGYCTPGFIVAITGCLDGRGAPASRAEVAEALTGNLCRCTGYDPILAAGAAVDPARLVPLRQRFAGALMLESLLEAAREPFAVTAADGRRMAAPTTLEEAVRFRAANPGCAIVQGATDLGVQYNKRGHAPRAIVSLAKIGELDALGVSGGVFEVGANVTLARLEAACREPLPELARILALFGSPQIRNAGTLAGNIANGSPIADTLPCLNVLGAEVELAGPGGRRRVRVDRLFRGYKDLDIAADELIARVLVPLPQPHEKLLLYKVSKRKDLDISSFTAAMLFSVVDGRIVAPRLAAGGVGPVVMRLARTEAFLDGREIEEGALREAGRIARGEIAPISDVRGAAEFRAQLAENVFARLYWDLVGDPVAVPWR